MKEVGIIGCGSFGLLLAGLLAPHVPVLVVDKQPIDVELPCNVRSASFDEVAQCAIVVIATDLAGIRPVCKQLASKVGKRTIIMDVCSVKLRPAEIMREELGGKCRLLATHPLFGPSSVASNGGSCRGLTWVWSELAGGPFTALEVVIRDKLGVHILPMTPDEHDQQMAWVHGLTFFVGRALAELHIPEVTLDTGYAQKLRELFAVEKAHSQALFDTVEAGNPYAVVVRERFMSILQRLDNQERSIKL